MNNKFKNIGSSPSGRYVIIGSVWAYPDLSRSGIRGNKKKHLMKKIEVQGDTDTDTVGERLTTMGLMVNGPGTTVMAWEDLQPFIHMCVEKATWEKMELKPGPVVPEM